MALSGHHSFRIQQNSNITNRDITNVWLVLTLIYVQANCYTNLYKFAIYNDHSYYEFMANNEVSLILDLPLGTTYIFQYYSSLSTVSRLFYNNFAKKFLQIPYKHITNYGYNKVFFLRSLEIRYINKFCCTCLRHLSIHIWCDFLVKRKFRIQF